MICIKLKCFQCFHNFHNGKYRQYFSWITPHQMWIEIESKRRERASERARKKINYNKQLTSRLAFISSYHHIIIIIAFCNFTHNCLCICYKRIQHTIEIMCAIARWVKSEWKMKKPIQKHEITQAVPSRTIKWMRRPNDVVCVFFSVRIHIHIYRWAFIHFSCYSSFFS